jgi:hypothetical protein
MKLPKGCQNKNGAKHAFMSILHVLRRCSACSCIYSISPVIAMGDSFTVADTPTMVGGITTMVDETKTMVGDTLSLAKR